MSISRSTPKPGAGSAQVTFNYSADAGVVSQVNGAAVTIRWPLAAIVCPAPLRPGTGALRYGRDPADLAFAQLPGPLATEGVARFLAQWAVNVVAYRDHNSIMIPFPYDPNPFTPNTTNNQYWNPPGTPSINQATCTRSGVASGPNC